MQEFLELYQDYQGTNTKIISYAAELKASKELTSDLLDEYDVRRRELEEELKDQEESDNPMFDSDTEHKLCYNELI